MAALLLRRQTKQEARTDKVSHGKGSAQTDPGGCGLQSTVTGVFLPGPARYLLAISSYDWDPAGAAGDIWNDTPYGVERPPDGPGAPGPVIFWGGTGFNEGPYSILLTGAEFCESPVSVEPSSWGVASAPAARTPITSEYMSKNFWTRLNVVLRVDYVVRTGFGPLAGAELYMECDASGGLVAA